MKFEEFYNKNYKKLMLIPALILIASIVIIGIHYNKEGMFFKKDASLQGGTVITVMIEQEINRLELEQFLRKELGNDVFVRTGVDSFDKTLKRVEVEAGESIEEKNILDKLREMGIEITEKNHSIRKTSAILGESAYREIFIAILIAFVFMAIIVFISFRTFIPSLAVVLAAMTDILGTIAVINLLNIKMSIGGIAAILLLIGYSVDTDILMSTKVLKRREGTINERLLGSFKTGMTMTMTTITALLIAYIFTNVAVFKQMFFIILVGLLIDIISTYLQNASILKWYAEKRGMAGVR